MVIVHRHACYYIWFFFFFSLSLFTFIFDFFLSFFIRTLGVFFLQCRLTTFLDGDEAYVSLEKKRKEEEKKKKKKRPQAGPGGGRLRFSYHQKSMPSLPSSLPFLPFLTLSRTDGHSETGSGPITFFFFFFLLLLTGGAPSSGMCVIHILDFRRKGGGGGGAMHFTLLYNYLFSRGGEDFGPRPLLEVDVGSAVLVFFYFFA